jgi:drug/metabolite transporter (DMT)-like permease
MSGAIVSFCIMAMMGRALGDDLDTFEIMLYRSLVGVVLVTVGAAYLGRLGEISTQHFGLHLARNVSHFMGQNLWFYAVLVAPLAQVFALEFSAPLWVVLLAPVVLGEKLTRVRAFCALLGFLGILIVARPGLGGLGPGVIAAAIAAVGFAGSILFTKLLTRRVSVVCILFWLAAMQSTLGLITAGWDGDIALPSREGAPYVLVIACCGLLAHLCITTALTLAPATVVVPMDFLRLPIIAVIGVLVYNETLDAYVLVGALIIFAANYLNIWVEARRVTVS